MTGNGNNPNVTIATPQMTRVRASGPILIAAMLFVVASFLSWYFTWFGRELSAAEISNYLTDDKHPRHVQHALLQIQQRIERKDQTAKRWYPQILRLADNPETEFRLTVAWLMGLDNESQEFHQALLKLVRDSEPIVRRNAALALVRFHDASGRGELVAILQPHSVKATAEGVVASTLHEGSQLARGALLARITQPENGVTEIRSPLPATVAKILAPNGSRVSAGDAILTLKSDEESLWEALRGLSLIGEAEDLAAIDLYARGVGSASGRIKQQAALTAQAIQSRPNSQGKYVRQ
jgi:hypothetical protein